MKVGDGIRLGISYLMPEPPPGLMMPIIKKEWFSMSVDEHYKNGGMMPIG